MRRSGGEQSSGNANWRTQNNKIGIFDGVSWGFKYLINQPYFQRHFTSLGAFGMAHNF